MVCDISKRMPSQEKFIPLYTFSGKQEGEIDVEEAKLKARAGDLVLSSNGKQGRRYRVTAAHMLPRAKGLWVRPSGGYTVVQLEV